MKVIDITVIMQLQTFFAYHHEFRRCKPGVICFGIVAEVNSIIASNLGRTSEWQVITVFAANIGGPHWENT